MKVEQTYSSDIVESLKIKQELFDLKKKKVQCLKKKWVYQNVSVYKDKN